MSRFDLILFDCDGVLVDSEPITIGVIAQMLGELGVSITLEQATRLYVGKSLKEDRTITRGLLGRDPPADFYPQFLIRRDAALQESVQPVKHIQTALAEIRQPYAVASGADLPKMHITLGRTGLLPLFEGRLFSATMVQRSKPAPDVYLLAARTLTAPPTRCAVIEDTATGVAAGVAAGMTVFGYCERQDPESLLAAGAQAVFNDMRRLPMLVG